MLNLETQESTTSINPTFLSETTPGAVRDVIDAVENRNSSQIDTTLARLIEQADDLGLPQGFLAESRRCLDSGNWQDFAHSLRSLSFVGEEGRFLIVAPYTTSRKGKQETLLSAIYGSRLSLGEIPALRPIVEDIFGHVNESIPSIVPVIRHSGAGWFAGESGEAFIVPNGWPELPHGDGPVLNNMSEQLGRVAVAFEAIRTIFDEPSANLVLGAYTPQARLMSTLHTEYSFHEAGHASGAGLSQKFASGVLNSPFYGSVEEWRSDGVAFEVARRALPAETVGTLVASNVITRFGIDAHRRGTIHLDTDVNSALLLFNSLLNSGMLKVYPDNSLGFVDPTYKGLSRATEMMSASAIALTRQEMQLPEPRAIWTLYPSAISVPDSVRKLFLQTVVNPCLGFFRELR